MQLAASGILIFLCLLTLTAGAHHSSAMFDGSKIVAISGNVKEFQYTQPHCWIVVVVPGTGGAPDEEWRIEAAAPTALARMGIKKNAFLVGDKITVRFHPLRDGRTGGEIIEAIKADGTKVVLNLGAPPPDAEQSPTPARGY